MHLSSLLQFLVTGVTVGSLYAAVALGFVATYTVTGVINFVQGEYVMLGGMLVIWLAASGWPVALALPAAVLISTALGAGLWWFGLRPARRATPAVMIIITLGAAMAVRGVAVLLWGTEARTLPPLVGGEAVPLLGARLDPQYLLVMAATAVLMLALYLFFAFTLTGKALRACAADGLGARLVGVRPELMGLLAFALSAVIGSLSGVLMAPISYIAWDMGAMLGLKGFAGAVLGGLENPRGAVIGGLVVGLLEALAAGLISSGYRDAIAFLLLFAVLFVRQHRLARLGGGAD